MAQVSIGLPGGVSVNVPISTSESSPHCKMKTVDSNGQSVRKLMCKSPGGQWYDPNATAQQETPSGGGAAAYPTDTSSGQAGSGDQNGTVSSSGESSSSYTGSQTAAADLSGEWRSESGGIFEVTQSGRHVTWEAHSPDGITWTHHFDGDIEGDELQGVFYDHPPGRFHNGGPLTFRIDGSRLVRTNTTQAFADSTLMREAVYEAQQRGEENGSEVAEAPRGRSAYRSPPLVAADMSAIAGGDFRRISLSLNNIDDMGFAFIVPAKGEPAIAAAAEWNVQNQGGSARADLTRYLETGPNLVVFVLHNKYFAFGSGKWAFNATLSGDRGAIWQNSDVEYSGEVGIRYWKPFLVTKRANGTVHIETAPQDVVTHFTPLIQNLNDNLIQKFGTEQSAYMAAVGVFEQGIIQDMFSSSGGSGVDPQYGRSAWCQNQNASGNTMSGC